MNKIKKLFLNFWNNNHISEEEYKYYFSDERRSKYPEALHPIGFRDWVLCWVIALMFVSLVLYFI